MTERADKKPLKLVRNFSRIAGTEDAEKQYGYQKIDDTTVLERKQLPVSAYTGTYDIDAAVIIRVYDFKNFEVITYVQQTLFATEESAQPPQVFIKSFGEMEGRQGILDAHAALTQLKGSPPPLDDIPSLEPKRVLRVGKPVFPGSGGA